MSGISAIASGVGSILDPIFSFATAGTKADAEKEVAKTIADADVKIAQINRQMQSGINETQRVMLQAQLDQELEKKRIAKQMMAQHAAYSGNYLMYGGAVMLLALMYFIYKS